MRVSRDPTDSLPTHWQRLSYAYPIQSYPQLPPGADEFRYLQIAGGEIIVSDIPGIVDGDHRVSSCISCSFNRYAAPVITWTAVGKVWITEWISINQIMVILVMIDDPWDACCINGDARVSYERSGSNDGVTFPLV